MQQIIKNTNKKRINIEKLSIHIKKLVTEKGGVFDAPLPQFEKVGHVGLSYETLANFVDTMPMVIQSEVKDQLVVLDFNNLDVFDFLDHLINGMIASTGANESGGYTKTKLGTVVED